MDVLNPECAAQSVGPANQLFGLLIQTILAAQCAISPKDMWPKDYGPTAIEQGMLFFAIFSTDDYDIPFNSVSASFPLALSKSNNKVWKVCVKNDQTTFQSLFTLRDSISIGSFYLQACLHVHVVHTWTLYEFVCLSLRASFSPSLIIKHDGWIFQVFSNLLKSDNFNIRYPSTDKISNFHAHVFFEKFCCSLNPFICFGSNSVGI